jgi:hypothetical protein
VSRWETTATLDTEASPAATWEKAYVDAAAWPPGARMGHRHLVEPTPTGSRLTNTIYIAGPLAGLWRRILGPAAARSLPQAQQAIAELARA